MRLGSLKQIAVALPGYGIYCSHDSIGYEQTFRTAVHALAETLTMRNAEAESRYLELQVARVGDMRVGVSMLELAEDEDGDTRMRMRMSLLLPTGEASLSAMDSLTFQWTNPAGELLNSGEVSIENGEVDTDLDVQPDESGQWIVKGKFKGKDLEAKIGAERPQSLVAQAKARRALLAGPKPIGGELRHQEGEPDPERIARCIERDRAGGFARRESIRQSLEAGHVGAGEAHPGEQIQKILGREVSGRPRRPFGRLLLLGGKSASPRVNEAPRRRPHAEEIHGHGASPSEMAPRWVPGGRKSSAGLSDAARKAATRASSAAGLP